MVTVTISPNDAGQRLDRYLRKLLAHAPLSLIHKLLRTKKVKVGGKAQKKDYQLRSGDELVIYIRDAEFTTFTHGTEPKTPVAAISFSVIFEDDDLLVVNKPAGLPSQPGSGYTGPSLVDEVLHYLHQSAPARSLFRPALANRLDRGTSGLVIVGKSGKALRALNAQLAAGKIEKIYLAIVQGIVKQKSGTIDTPIQETDQPDPHKPKMVIGSGKSAVTHYRVQKTVGRCTVLEIKLETGRTHQIRVHLASIGHAVVGDTRYGSAPVQTPLMLHAWKLRFIHPVTNKPLSLEAPLPPPMLQFIRNHTV